MRQRERKFNEIIAENFPSLQREKEGLDIQFQEVQKSPNRFNTKKFSTKHIIMKMSKVNEKILRAAKKKVSSDI